MNEQMLKNEQSSYVNSNLMVLLEESINYNEKILVKQLKKSFPNYNISVTSAEDGALIVELGQATFAVMMIDTSIPKDTFDVALRTSYGLKDGEHLVDKHKAHLIVSPLTETSHAAEMISVSIDLMRLTSSLAKLGKPSAYFWSNSEVLHDQTQFDNALKGINKAIELKSKGEPNAATHFPTIFWVGLRLYSPDQKTKFGAITQGLAAFTGFELDIEPINWKPDQIANRVFGTIAYLFDRGDVLKDGDTLGINENEHFKVAHKAATDRLPARLALIFCKNNNQ